MKKLIIAEKPSVAADIARSLGGFAKHDEYFESDEYVLSSAVGHLLEIKAPEEFEVKRGKWSFANLPVLPPHFDLNPIKKTESRLKVLTKLIKRKDVGGLINACDAGREGELIFRLIVDFAKSKLPVERLWLQSMTPASIRQAFTELRTDQDMMPLADAARCRSEADWMVGINGTRAMTAFNSKEGGFYLTTVGRVQTPTLTIVVEREEKIRKFKPRTYFEVKASFGAKAGAYEGKWFDPAFKKNDDPDQRADRLWDEAKAKSIVAACEGKQGDVEEESKPSSQMSPQLFDLTSLQREANSRFGFSAKNTLGLAQALYEKHKVLTYPRTDSKALPEDYMGTVVQTLQAFGALRKSDLGGEYAGLCGKILKNEWVKPNKRIFDNTKVSDHFAIIPTLQTPKSLSEPEQKLYDMVVRRFLAVFFPAAEYNNTTRITTVERHQFKTEGKVLINPGWLEVYGKKAAVGDEDSLVAVEKGEKVSTDEIEMATLQTRPPARYSEATLLSAMEGAGKLVDDDELRIAMGTKGLGTPATRAAIIEGLLAEKYLLREERALMPTAKAFQLLTLLRGLGVQELTMPELTGEWEHKLSQMEKGELSRKAFMEEIKTITQTIVDRAKNYTEETIPGDYATLETPCPNCASVVKENYRRFACTKCEFSITKVPGGRAFEVEEVEKLLKDRELPLLDGFRSKMGRPFAAALRLTTDHKLEFDFGQGKDDDDGEEVDFSGEERVGPCPKCASDVFETTTSFICEKTTGPNKSCDFRSGKVILQQPIEREQMEKLLLDGKTDLMTRFVSSRTRRAFKAFLVKKEDGTIGFEFEPRAEKKPAAGKAGVKKADEAGDAAAADSKKKTAVKAVAKPAAKKPAAKKPAAKATAKE
ncbi:MAG: DNA topoisomerase III [Limnobacter sp.]|nr:DNA topoisomerase III [Limnobacter sp.]